MAQPSMQCQGCKRWFDVRPDATKVPDHYRTAGFGRSGMRAGPCSGGGSIPFRTRDFPVPPRSVQ